MDNVETLKKGRNLLLSLHKSLLDFERLVYEGTYGKVSAGAFLNLLLEDENFSWLRRFSGVIVEIDELLAQRDGFSDEAVSLHIEKVRDVILFTDEESEFSLRYRGGLQQNVEAAAIHAELQRLLA
ncbi:MAG TPA: hypothetical protein PKD26_08625 [Pyrinomonadaceae bacterium]|nr:hypothetical protein [Pyrinomonadaceae bacterium]